MCDIIFSESILIIKTNGGIKMAFNQVIKSVKIITDTKRNFCIYTKDGKNYLISDGKEYELPSGNISMKNSDIFIDGKMFNLDEYIK